MRFEQLQQHVERAEKRVELRGAQTSLYWTILKQTWKDGWTPGRIVIAGLAAGFLVGRARPLRIASGGGVLQLLTALSGLLASGSAQAAAAQAGDAADAVEAAASPTDPAVRQDAA